jgi:hypothetical protein
MIMIKTEKDDREKGQENGDGEAEGEGSQVEEAVCVENLEKRTGLFSLAYFTQ